MGEWFSVKGIFRWFFKEDGKTALFEERIIIVKADSFDEALDKAEIEAVKYCEEDPKANYQIESLKKFYAYEILEEELSEGIEVFSNRREIALDSGSYLERFYPETLIKSTNKAKSADAKKPRG